MHDEKCGCNGSIRAYNPFGHEIKMEIPEYSHSERTESKPALEGLSWRQTGVYSSLPEGQKISSGWNRTNI